LIPLFGFCVPFFMAFCAPFHFVFIFFCNFQSFFWGAYGTRPPNTITHDFRNPRHRRRCERLHVSRHWARARFSFSKSR
jgi:hypothetical protein